MQEHKNTSLPSKKECKDFTLFLDRDGVINMPIIDDYAKKPSDFVLIPGSVAAIRRLKELFKQVIIVTNQQGIHKGVMSETDLEDVHLKLYNTLRKEGVAYFDATYFAPYLKDTNHAWRKPNTGMTKKTESEFDIDWNKAILVGDSPGDMQLADNVGATKVKINNSQFSFDNQDYTFNSLKEFSGSFS
jgi:histidinol-phosphate phosphatase family protein